MTAPGLKCLFEATDGKQDNEEGRIPLVSNELAVYYLTGEGEVFLLRAGDEEPEPVGAGLKRNAALRLGSKVYGPVLMELLPVKPKDAEDCGSCQGTGFAAREAALLACRDCQALGWLGVPSEEVELEPAVEETSDLADSAEILSQPVKSADINPTPCDSVEKFKPHDDYILIQKWKSWGIVALCSLLLFLVTLILALAAPPIALNIAVFADVAVIALVIWLAVLWPKLIHKHYAYLIHPHAVEIHKGMAWRRVIVIPRSRLQHVDVVQGPIERSFDLADLVLHTAGSVAAKNRLKGLTHEHAQSLSQRLVGPEQACEVPGSPQTVKQEMPASEAPYDR